MTLVPGRWNRATRRGRTELWTATIGVVVALSAVVAALGGATSSASATEASGSMAISSAVQQEMGAAEHALVTADGTDASPLGSCDASDSGLDAECTVAAANSSAAPSPLPFPTHRWGAEITYDAADGYPLLFGGQNDTWAFEQGYWIDLHPKVIPPIVSFACLTYDWKDGYVLLYGGGRGGIGTPDLNRDLTWTFRGGVWTNITNPAASPPGLQYPSCTYDAAPGDGYVVLFGGADGEGPTYTGQSYLTIHSSDQTWKFSGGKWTNITDLNAPHPSARFGAAMAYDDASGYVVLYGGAVNGTSTANGSCSPAECPHLNDTWTFVGGVWTNITAAASVHGTPPGRWEAGIANDSADGYLVIFGGQANGYKSYNATGNYTWAFEDGVWTNLTSSLPISPQTRFGEAMGYDPATQSVLMFSGLNCTRGAVLWENTWSFAGGTWSQLTYFMNFTETGLASGTSWHVTITPGIGAASTWSSNTSRLELGWATGAYSYAVAGVTHYRITGGGPTGTVSVRQPQADVDFSPYTYTVKFAETGLHASWKAKWAVTMNGTAKSRTSASISFAGLVPGSYSYLVGPVANYSLNRSYSGVVTVSTTGTTELSATLDLRWTLITYKVTFRETGLPAGTLWEVTLNGKTHTSTSGSVAFSVSNGTYAFTVASAGYLPDPANGQVPVNGQAATQRIEFSTGAPGVTATGYRAS